MLAAIIADIGQTFFVLKISSGDDFHSANKIPRSHAKSPCFANIIPRYYGADATTPLGHAWK